ncbi:MAG: hypothetical protein QY331_02340 [Melioribacteraceae bacterium]|nr:MAG: hypothetical protein QY331_02340 [Melioribacteraceae bacterium]
MIYQIKFPFAVVSVFMWIGFVSAISFLEAWLKFKAPGITLPLGLGIGKLVFGALNKVEWALAFIIILNFVLADGKIITIHNLAYFLPVVILLIQTFWLLPILGERADLYINNQSVPGSNIHFLFIALEVIKVISLIIFGMGLFKSVKQYIS